MGIGYCLTRHSHYFHQENEEKKNKATKGNGEPLAFSTLEMGNTMSDNYSYWNMNSDELSAKGNGGTYNA